MRQIKLNLRSGRDSPLQSILLLNFFKFLNVKQLINFFLLVKTYKLDDRIQ